MLWLFGVRLLCYNFNVYRFEKIKEFESHQLINSSSLHPTQPIFVSGGEDFKMYKFDFDTGAEIGNA